MMKTFFPIMAAIMVAVVFGCNPQRKIQKAIKTVTYNDTAFQHVGLLWEKFHPCANDSVINYDTIYEPIFIDAEIDVDSLRDIICDTTRPQPDVIRVPGKCPPTKIIRETITVRDVRHEMIIRDSLARETDLRRQYQAELMAARNSAAECQKNFQEQTKNFGKDLTKRTLITVIPAILIIAALLYALFKRKSKIL